MNNVKCIRKFQLLFVVCVILAVTACSLYAAPPSGFTALGTVLPDDGVFGHSAQVIKDKNLTEIIPPEWTTNEKWGTSITSDDEARGYIVFNRHYIKTVNYYSVPNNRVDSLSIFSSLGEYEPITFSFYPFKDINDVKISVTDLKNSSGQKIDKENIDVRFVRAIPFDRSKENYVLRPVLIEKRNSINLTKNKSSQVWMTFYAPKNAVPGTYAGTIKIDCKDSAPYNLKLSVKVLPIKLAEPNALYGMCFLINGRKNQHAENLDKYFVDLRAHNMNSMWTWPDSGIKKQGDRIIYDFSKFGFSAKNDQYFGNSLDEMVDGYLKAGFTRPWICGTLSSVKDLIVENLGYQYFTPEFNRAYIDYITQLQTHAKKKGWPEFYVHVQDEPSHGSYDTMKFAMYYNKFVKDNFPKLSLFMDGAFNDGWIMDKEDRVLYPYLDVMCYAQQSREDMEFCKQVGLDYWIYNHFGAGVNPNFNRDGWGVHTYKAGAGGAFHWVYTWWTEPNLPGDWSFYISPAPDGPIPSPSWESAREGIDDAKYLTTLSNLIAKAKATGQKNLIVAAAQATGCITTVLSTVPVGKIESPAEEAALYSYYGNNPAENYDLNRWKVAMQIIKLQSLLAKQPVKKIEPMLAKDDEHTLGMWHFDDGYNSTVQDDNSFNGSHKNTGVFGSLDAKIIGPPFVSKGIYKDAFQFAPYTAPIIISLNSKSNPYQFTYEAWINFAKIADDGSYFGALADRFSLRVSPDKSIVFLLNTANGGWHEIKSGFLAKNQWYHIAATYDGKIAKLYIDGILAGYSACEGEISGSADRLFIGSNAENNGGRFFGRIDEVRLSDIARNYTLPWE